MGQGTGNVLRYVLYILLSDRDREPLLPPANEVCKGYVFTGVCLFTRGTWVAGGNAWQGVCMVGACVGEMATAVGGMHPTGMHSCFLL